MDEVPCHDPRRDIFVMDIGATRRSMLLVKYFGKVVPKEVDHIPGYLLVCRWSLLQSLRMVHQHVLRAISASFVRFLEARGLLV